MVRADPAVWADLAVRADPVDWPDPTIQADLVVRSDLAIQPDLSVWSVVGSVVSFSLSFSCRFIYLSG